MPSFWAMISLSMELTFWHTYARISCRAHSKWENSTCHTRTRARMRTHTHDIHIHSLATQRITSLTNSSTINAYVFNGWHRVELDIVGELHIIHDKIRTQSWKSHHQLVVKPFKLRRARHHTILYYYYYYYLIVVCLLARPHEKFFNWIDFNSWENFNAHSAATNRIQMKFDWNDLSVPPVESIVKLFKLTSTYPRCAHGRVISTKFGQNFLKMEPKSFEWIAR